MNEEHSRAYLWDAFISHAREDKKPLVAPLVTALQALGYRIWYDLNELKLGDSLKGSIEVGLARSRFGIVVLSKAFFSKRWPRMELEGLFAFERDGRKVILPIWHEMTEQDVALHSPLIAGRLAIASTEGLSAICAALADVLGPPSKSADRASTPASTLNTDTSETKAFQEVSEPLSYSEQTEPIGRPIVDARAATRIDSFLRQGKAGGRRNVDFLMSELQRDPSASTSLLVDSALSAVHRPDGIERIRFYLFHGDIEQRRHAAGYFRKTADFGVLKRAHEQGKIDSVQAFSRQKPTNK